MTSRPFYLTTIIPSWSVTCFTNWSWAHNPNLVKKIHVAFMLKTVIQSVHKFAHAMAAELLWHVHNCNLIAYSELVRTKGFFTNFNYDFTNLLWTRHQKWGYLTSFLHLLLVFICFIFRIIETLFTFWKSCLYSVNKNYAQQEWCQSNMNKILQIILNAEKCPKWINERVALQWPPLGYNQRARHRLAMLEVVNTYFWKWQGSWRCQYWGVIESFIVIR